nr:hypothetical protein [Tanacetum cinerariifolium]
SYTDKVKVINAKAERISAAGETLNAATLTVSTVTLAIPKQTTTGKETSNPFMAGRLLKNVKDAKVSNEFKFVKEKIKE